MKRIVVHSLSDSRMGGIIKKTYATRVVKVFVAFKKCKYFLNYTHITNIRVNFIKITIAKDKLELQFMVRKNKISQML
jgi:hypothetical protein